MYSPRQVAKAIGVSEASLKRWCDRGLLPVQRTAGGHRRISKRDVLTFVRANEHDLVNPSVLGLPQSAGKNEATLSLDALLDTLLSADEQSLRGLFTSWYLSGQSLTTLFDQGLGPAFLRIGELWQSGEIEVYQERQSAELCRRALYELISLIPEPTGTRPLALGAGLRDDPYELANLMVEAALKEMGWQSETLGINLPGDTIAKAVATREPRLFWLSVSSVTNETTFVQDCALIWQACLANRTLLAAGGRGLTAALRAEIKYTVYCDRVGDLVDFLKSTAG